MTFIDLIKAFGQPLVTSFIAELALVIKNRLRKRVPDFIARRLAGKFSWGFFEVPPGFVVSFVSPGESDDDQIPVRLTVGGGGLQRRDEFAMSTVPRS